MENTTYSNIEKITDEAPRNIEHKELETLIIASIETLKRQKMKCGIDEVRKLVQDSLEENISLESFEKTLQHLIDNDSVKSNSVSNRVCLSIPKNNTYRDAFNIKEELQSFKNELVEKFNRLTQAFFAEINSLKSDALTTDAPTDEHSSYISSLREEIEYLREENRTKTLIIKQLTEIKATVNPTNTLVTYNKNSTDKTTQNSDNVIDKTIQNNNKEPFKNKKNTNKNLANTKTLSTTDNFTSTCLEHPKNEKYKSQNGKNTSEANEKKKQKKKKEDNHKEPTNRNNENKNNKNKTNVYILGDSIVKKLNGYLLTRKIKHKHLVKVRSFSGAKISCMRDHVKPTLRDINPDHIILHAGTNDLRTENTASQIAKATIDLATSLKNDDNTVTVSGIVPRLDDLDNKANEVNRRLVLMCKERNTSFLSHDESIDPSKHLERE